MKTYIPNISDPRVSKRINSALDFVNKYIKSTPTPSSQSQIDSTFGRASRDIGKYLRDKLLTVHDNHYNFQTGKCKTYIRNQAGYEELKKLVNFREDRITWQMDDELFTGNFTYTEKSDRLYNPLQFIKTEIRRPLFAQYGYNYNYDIMCAAPTLLLQYAQELGLETKLTALQEYINNRQAVRARIAKELEVEDRVVKLILNSMLNGAVISAFSQKKIFQYVDQDKAKILWLQQDPFVQAYKQDIKTMWAHIKKVENITRLTEKGKSAIYRKLEKKVMTHVHRFMKKQKIAVFKEHDGWRCNKEIDQLLLYTYVRQKTGYKLTFDVDVYL